MARLVTVDHDRLEITHEALIRHWPRLGRWLTEDRDGLRVHRQLTAATAGWVALRHHPAALYRGAQLAVAHQWAIGRDVLLTAKEREFLATSVRAEHATRMMAPEADPPAAGTGRTAQRSGRGGKQFGRGGGQVQACPDPTA
ncbi:MAG TPA: hypothetical protein VHV74_08335 [Pseudonocardiaceae bacterium]|nr:hypothetical protein [Pseudonocardiaceae bacterium]